jgi:hypothetical protein
MAGVTSLYLPIGQILLGKEHGSVVMFYKDDNSASFLINHPLHVQDRC